LQVKWFSPFLLAVYDRHSESFQSLCRVMSGFTDEFYAAAKERLSASIIPGPKPYYNTGESPSVWFEPTEVRCRGGWPGPTVLVRVELQQAGSQSTYHVLQRDTTAMVPATLML
jgi:hypothetical protein